MVSARPPTPADPEVLVRNSSKKFTHVMDMDIDSSANIEIDTHIAEIIQLYLYQDILYVIGFQNNELVCTRIDATRRTFIGINPLQVDWPKSRRGNSA